MAGTGTELESFTPDSAKPGKALTPKTLREGVSEEPRGVHRTLTRHKGCAGPTTQPLPAVLHIGARASGGRLREVPKTPVLCLLLIFSLEKVMAWRT